MKISVHTRTLSVLLYRSVKSGNRQGLDQGVVEGVGEQVQEFHKRGEDEEGQDMQEGAI